VIWDLRHVSAQEEDAEGDDTTGGVDIISENAEEIGNETATSTLNFKPSLRPSISPTITSAPSDEPSLVPTVSQVPSGFPSEAPTKSSQPSSQPTISFQPTLSMIPSDSPSNIPSDVPTLSLTPSLDPTISNQPTASFSPTNLPSLVPSDPPSTVPTVSLVPSDTPTIAPTGKPSSSPSAVPSRRPSSAPTYTPISATRDVGMYVTGLVKQFNQGSSESRQFQELVDRHILHYWLNATNVGTIVYESNTTFTVMERPDGDWGPRVFSSSNPDGNDEQDDTAVRIFLKEKDTGSPTGLQEQEAHMKPRQIGDDSVNAPDGQNQTLLPGNLSNFFTFAPTIGGNANVSSDTDVNVTSRPTMSPTITTRPSTSPSDIPTNHPTFSLAPSVSPTVTVPPSSQPSEQPKLDTWVIWYTQVISYGEKFDINDTRANNEDDIFRFPFIYNQLPFTNELIRITGNQLPIFVEEVETRDGSAAPSTEVSEPPSVAPSMAPSLAPTPEVPSGGGDDISTTEVIVAVVVPVLIVLLIAFAGIIYVTRIEHDSPGGSFEGEVIPLPADQQDPGTPPGVKVDQTLSALPPLSVGGTEQQGNLSCTPVPVHFGTRNTGALIDPSGQLTVDGSMSQQEPPVAFRQEPTRVSSGKASQSGSDSMYPMDFVASPHRTTSNASYISDVSADSRRAHTYFGGIGSGTFIPTLESVPSYVSFCDCLLLLWFLLIAGVLTLDVSSSAACCCNRPDRGELHSRESSRSDAYIFTPFGRPVFDGIQRANTTDSRGEQSSNRGLQRPHTTGEFQRVSDEETSFTGGMTTPTTDARGAQIPSMATEQMSVATDGITSEDEGDGYNNNEMSGSALSEYESDADEYPQMGAFCMQVRDIDD